MKTLIFFHREELTFLYLPMSRYLKDKMNIIHLAYSQKEEKILREAGIKEIVNFSDKTRQLFDTEKLDAVVLNEIDRLLIENTNGRFNLNQSIQSDRGFSILNYEEAQLCAQVYYKFWEEIFSACKVDYILHEPCSLFFNHIGAILCKAQGGQYIWHLMSIGEQGDLNYLNITGDDFTCPEIKKKYEFYTIYPEKIDRIRCKKFLEKFRASYGVYLGNMIKPKASKAYLIYRACRESMGKLMRREKPDQLKQNIDYWLFYQKTFREKLRNLKEYKKQALVFEDLPEGEAYYYYSFHLEPEAVVLYLGDGFYTNQVKLIENIAASLPPHTYLYVKDHPHEYGYRKASDYVRLKSIPNIRLLKQSIPGKQVIKNAIGVFTINGTAGFEGLLLNKQVYTFGWSHYCYCPRVNYVYHIRDLRNILYKNRSILYKDDNSFLAYINAYLDSLHTGLVDFFMGRAASYHLDLEKNAEQIARDLLLYTENSDL